MYYSALKDVDYSSLLLTSGLNIVTFSYQYSWKGVEKYNFTVWKTANNLIIKVTNYNIRWEWAGVPDHWNRKYRTTQNSVGERKEGRKEESEEDWICTWRGGGEAGVRSPHWGICLGQRWSIWGWWRVKQLICDSLNGITQIILATAGQVHEPPRKLSGWELEHRD